MTSLRPYQERNQSSLSALRCVSDHVFQCSAVQLSLDARSEPRTVSLVHHHEPIRPGVLLCVRHLLLLECIIFSRTHAVPVGAVLQATSPEMKRAVACRHEPLPSPSRQRRSLFVHTLVHIRYVRAGFGWMILQTNMCDVCQRQLVIARTPTSSARSLLPALSPSKKKKNEPCLFLIF